jgi:leucyl/phenylalanyl-tRNA---protein transferase
LRAPQPPIEPPPSTWQFPDPQSVEGDLVCLGGDLEPGTLLSAYRSGLFPMPVKRRTMGWWSPDPRAVVPLDGLIVSKSLRRSQRRYTVTTDRRFGEVMDACADPRRRHGWITPPVIAAYTTMHRLGWAHSVEAWDEHGELAGGLYGIAIGGLFAGESMFHWATDASKVALVDLVERLRGGGFRLLDVQWLTPHLASLGAVPLSRSKYLARLPDALAASAQWRGSEPAEDDGLWLT